MMLNRRWLLQISAAAAVGTGCALPTRAFSDSQALTPARGVSAAPGLSFAGLFVATRKRIWANNGLDYSLKFAEGGLPTFAALDSGEADFACIASSDPLIAWDRGIKTIAVAAFSTGLAMQFTARNDWMAKVGISPDSPIAAKIKAFKGARIGTGTIAGGPAQYTRYLLSLFGLDPFHDIELLAVGLGAARIAALRQNQVDIIVGSAPEADQVELQEFGSLYVNCSTEIEVFRDFPYTVLVVPVEYLESKPKLVASLARSVAEANTFIIGNMSDSVQMLAAEFPKIDARAIERSMKRDAQTVSAGGRMTEGMWRNAIGIARKMKTIKGDIDPSEGNIWTNKFLA